VAMVGESGSDDATMIAAVRLVRVVAAATEKRKKFEVFNDMLESEQFIWNKRSKLELLHNMSHWISLSMSIQRLCSLLVMIIDCALKSLAVHGLEQYSSKAWRFVEFLTQVL
jgi:hypothetical protein